MKIGTMELVVILLVAFLVLGPDQTAIYTKKLGKALKTLRIYMNSFTEEITETVAEPLRDLREPLEELKKPFEELQKPLEDSVSAVQKPFNELEHTVRDNDSKLKATLDKPLAAEDLEDAVAVEEAITVEALETAAPVAKAAQSDNTL